MLRKSCLLARFFSFSECELLQYTSLILFDSSKLTIHTHHTTHVVSLHISPPQKTLIDTFTRPFFVLLNCSFFPRHTGASVASTAGVSSTIQRFKKITSQLSDLLSNLCSNQPEKVVTPAAHEPHRLGIVIAHVVVTFTNVLASACLIYC